MAQDLVVNGITYNGVESLSMRNADGGTVEYVSLPALTNPASDADVMLGKEYITDSGDVGTGSFDLTPELTEQRDLIDQLLAALEGKAAGGATLPTQEKAVEITENGTVEVVPDEGYALSKVDVTVSVPGGPSIDGLPAGYYPAPYIQFTGQQTVDLGEICTQNTKLRVVFTRPLNEQQYLYGVVNSGNTASVTAYLSSSGTWRFGNRSQTRAVAVSADIVQTAIVDKTGADFANSNGSWSTPSNFTTIGTLILGGCRQETGAVGAAQFVGRVFVFDIWQGDTLARHWIPVVSAEGVYRFYDAATGSFADSLTDTPLEGGIL